MSFQAQLGDGSTLVTAPMEFEPPNLSPPGVPDSIGDVLQMTSFFFVFIPVAIVALHTGWFFLPTTAAMLSAAAFAQRE